MIATSTIVMYLLTYVNVIELGHIDFSQTRVWMAIAMGAAMALVMWSWMHSMYTDRRKNALILLGSPVVFAIAVMLVRSQATVGDVAWMRAMIPHHSIAILTSERARIRNPRVRALADKIVDSQRREIEEMKALIAELEHKP